jgi:hypothetical protein
MDINHETAINSKSLKGFLKSGKFWKAILGIILGGLGGFLIYYFVGCKTDACAAASNPYVTIITGGIFGFIMTCSPCLKLK